jgi:hypothetical protein
VPEYAWGGAGASGLGACCVGGAMGRAEGWRGGCGARAGGPLVCAWCCGGGPLETWGGGGGG